MTNDSSHTDAGLRDAGGPYAGIRIVDLTSMVSGPMATVLLGDQGADVIKVEAPHTGDMIRHIGSSRGGLSAIFNTVNRNKRSMMLDLRKEDGKTVLRRLVRTADVLVQNYRPGVADRMGIGAAALMAENPALVYVSISGFGEVGPYAGQRVYDVVIQALSGMAASQGEADRPELVRNIVCDKVTAVYAAQAIGAALFARERGHGGQHVHLSMLDASVAFLWPDVMQGETYLGEGVSPAASLHGILSAYQTTDGWIAILAISDAEFEGLAAVVEQPELVGDARFATVATRMQHARVLADIVRAYTRDRTTDALCAALRAAGVPSAPVNSAEEVASDEQVRASGLLVEAEHPHCGRIRVPGPIARFDATPAAIRTLAPLAGEHTDELLAELGIPGDEIADLRAAGVVAGPTGAGD